MAFKQPRVPAMRTEEGLAATIRELILFLKDFCMEAWSSHKRLEARVQAMQEEIAALKERMGDT